jgi:flagellar biosynthesis/type III secretory pathway M-ring protein FliF/YscJ|tara:strand:- start:122 stop:229 length:108 start_codon:yes stop_codon:yes gene_type:complete
MDKLTKWWNSLSKNGKMFAYGVAAIIVIIIISNII